MTGLKIETSIIPCSSRSDCGDGANELEQFRENRYVNVVEPSHHGYAKSLKTGCFLAAEFSFNFQRLRE